MKLLWNTASRTLPWLLVITWLDTAASTCTVIADNPCVFNTEDGTIDLSVLDSHTTNPFFRDIPGDSASSMYNVSFSYNPCTPFNEMSTLNHTIVAECIEVLFCERFYDVTVPNKSLAFYNLGDTRSGSITCGSDAKGRYVRYQGPKMGPVVRTSKVYLTCGKEDVAHSTLVPKTADISNDTDSFVFELRGQAACVVPTPIVTTPKPEPPEAGGMSVGSILLLTAFVGVAIYLLFGMLGRFLLVGARGVEVMPNLDFWRDFPSLVMDGCLFCRSVLCGSCGGKKAYEEL